MLRSRWINVAAALVGGIALLFGLTRMVVAPSLGAAVWTVLGVILLWWTLADWRKYRRGTPESEADGSHTIE